MKTQHHSTKIMNLESTHQIVPINSNFEMIIIVAASYVHAHVNAILTCLWRGHGPHGPRCLAVTFESK